MKRRMFLRTSAGVGLSLLGGCVAVQRETQPKSPLIGYLGTAAAADPANLRNIEDFRKGLREQGLIEGHNLTVDWRWAEGRGDPWARQRTAELVALGVRVIVTNGSMWSQARETTDGVPLVMLGMNAEELVARGWAASVAHPGGSVTGLSYVPKQAFRKRLEMLTEVVPRLRRLAVMTNLSLERTEAEFRESVGQAGLQGLVLDVRVVADIEPAFETTRAWGADAVATEGLLPPSLLAVPVATMALRSRLPTISSGSGPEVGGLMYYGAVFAEGYMQRRGAWQVARILAGTKPGDVPIEVASQARFIVNRATLAALGLTLPPHIAMQVTDWID